MSIDDIINALREEMLAQNYMNSNRYAFMTVTPEQRWKDWLRVNDRVIVEAAAFPAEDFMVDVKEPTDAELQAFFEKKDADGVAYKDREASPVLVAGTELPSEIPGFKIPRKIDLDYIEASYDSFLAKAEEKVTEEEIAKYYEDHKDPMFIKADTGLMEDPGTGGDTAGDRSTGDRIAEQPEAPASEAAPPAAEEQKDAAEEEKQSRSDQRGNGVFRLAAFQENAATDDATKTSEAPPADAKAGEAATTPPPETPATTAPAPPAVPAAAAAPATPATPEPPKKPLEFDALDKVKDQIRRPHSPRKRSLKN